MVLGIHRGPPEVHGHELKGDQSARLWVCLRQTLQGARRGMEAAAL